MKARSFSHVGITVRDFNEFVRFYWDVFKCPLVGVSDSPSERVKSFFGVDPSTPNPASPDSALSAGAPEPTCKIGWIRVPGGGVLEIFEFNPQLPHQPGPWNRVGLTHFSINIRNARKWHDYLKAKGVTIVSEPMQSPNGGQWFFFIKDCDGNLIELMDLGVMYYVLAWLGPLGGFLARHGWVKDYSQYYQPKQAAALPGTGMTDSRSGNTR
jgi:catechol 2,3-dioxygenase-like lactoylglutathione lyase family enzyme